MTDRIEELEKRALEEIEKLPEFTFKLSNEALVRAEKKRDEIVKLLKSRGIDIPPLVVEYAVLEALRRDLESEDFKPQITESAEAYEILAKWNLVPEKASESLKKAIE